MRPERLVQLGYDRIAESYRELRRKDTPDIAVLTALTEHLPADARLLDIGFGSGLPITATLARRFTTVGLDFSRNQVRLAKASVPDARFVCGDMRRLPFADSSFAGVCSYYAIIHVPRADHVTVLREVHRVLRPSGMALVCMGANDVPEWHEDYLGARMYWSHFDRIASLQIVIEAGLEVIEEQVIADATSDSGSGHLFVLAQKPA